MQKERRVNLRCNSFVEFCIQANLEQISWLNTLFGNTRTKFHCKFRYDSKKRCIVFRFKERFFYEVDQWGVRGDLCFESKQIDQIIQSYPWTLCSDHSASILTRDALLCIYDRIKDPRDMWSFMQVNKSFHYAGSTYSGYTLKIERLKLGSCVDVLPFDFIKDERRRFFALCFVSSNEDLEKKMVKMIGIDWDAHPLFHYCFNLSGLHPHIKDHTIIDSERICFRDLHSVMAISRRGSTSVTGRLMNTKVLLGDSSSKFSDICESIRNILKDK